MQATVAVDAARARELRVMKRRATALLVVVAAVFVLIAAFEHGSGWAYVEAAAEGSLVGGLADWFAVTAIFRHPLGVPIPHTAVIRERKDQFGETLGSFVQQNFLSPDVLTERLRAAGVVDRLAHWLAVPENAATAARHTSEILVGLADVIRDEDVQRVVHEEAERALSTLPVASLAGRALALMTERGRHQELFDAILRGLEHFLEENRTVLRQRFGDESPWWLPNAVEDRVFERLVDGFTNLLHAINEDPDHEVRARFDERVGDLVARLQTSPELQERGDEIKREILAHPELRRWSASLWSDVKVSLRRQTADPSSTLRRRLAAGAMSLGRRLEADPALATRLEELIERGVRFLAEHFHDEIAGLVSGTISRWDAEETSTKLELLLGRDLQFIRINGTVVGGLAGLAIHALAAALA